jgi:uncharacterized phage-like protein YoqJ
MESDEVVAQQLDQESEIYQKLKKKYPTRKLTILNFKEKLRNWMGCGNYEAEIYAFRDIVDAGYSLHYPSNLV